MNVDLTVGKPEKVLWRFCLPLFGSIIFQQLYNIADSFVAGKFIGEKALAAVGNSYEITLIFIAIAFGCNIGCSVIVSQLFGARNFRELKTAVYTTLISCAAVCAALMIFGVLFCGNMLEIIHTPKSIFADSKLYLDIYIYGLPFVFFYNVSTGIFSALGDSKTPFVFLAASSTANIAADIFFVTVLEMGVDGVAWATFICQGISCILAVFVVIKRLFGIKTAEKPDVFSWRLLLKMGKIAIPSILQQSFISVGNIVLQSIINTFGSGVIAGYSAAVKLNNLVTTALLTIGNGISNYSAQNLGADKYDRIIKGFRAGVKIILCLLLPIVALYFFACGGLIKLFIDSPTASALATGKIFLRIVSPFYIVIAFKFVSDGILRGMGRMEMFMASTFTDLILRIVLAYVLSKPFGSVGIWSSWPAGWIIATAMSYIFYRKTALKKPNRPSV